MAEITITFSPQWTVALTSDHPTARLAARELRGFLRSITGLPFPVEETDDGSGPGIRLTHDAGGDDGFRWQAGADGVDQATLENQIKETIRQIGASVQEEYTE